MAPPLPAAAQNLTLIGRRQLRMEHAPWKLDILPLQFDSMEVRVPWMESRKNLAPFRMIEALRYKLACMRIRVWSEPVTVEDTGFGCPCRFVSRGTRGDQSNRSGFPGRDHLESLLYLGICIPLLLVPISI